jgi:photosystem II stability/assembly factor-like uncharacterized protein
METETAPAGPRTGRTVRGKRRLLTAGAVALLTAGALGVVPAAAANQVAAKWTVKPVPAVANYPLKSVACSGTSCVALAAECGVGGCGGLLPVKAFYSMNKGTSWRAAALPSSIGNSSTTKVSCGSPDLCVAVVTKGPLGPSSSSAILLTRTGGKTWSVTDEAKYSLTSAVCASATDCFAIGSLKSSYYTSVSLFSTNGGKTWSVGGFPANLYYIDSAACASTTACLAVGEAKNYIDGVALSSTNAGRTWTKVPVPAGVTPILSANCDGLTCMGLGASQALISKNGGKSWTLHTLPAGRTFQAGSCLSATACIVVGYSTSGTELPVIDISGNSGLSWSPQGLPPVSDGSLTGAACEPGSCIAVGVRVVLAGKTAKAEYPYILGY